MNGFVQIGSAFILAGAAFGGCRRSTPRDEPGRTATHADSAATAAALITADRAFAAASAARGPAAWANAWAPDGSVADADSLISGPEPVFQHVAPLLVRYGARFRWDPDEAGVLWPDSLGYTIGHAWIASDADTAVWTGDYITLWTRDGDGWKVALNASLPACDDAPHAGDFDFWLGEWNVEQRIRTSEDSFEVYPAADHIRAARRGCVVIESWQGRVRFAPEMETPETLRGASIRIHDPRTNLWRIYWIDTRSERFGDPFVGRFNGDVGEFTPRVPSELPPRRIKFKKKRDDSVAWELAIRQPSGEWSQFWTMHFTRDSSAHWNR